MDVLLLDGWAGKYLTHRFSFKRDASAGVSIQELGCRVAERELELWDVSF
jgi:hypothetical protein